MIRTLLVLALVLLSAASAVAQTGDRCEGTGGVSVDDGIYETGFKCGGIDCKYVQRLVPDHYPALLTKACICWFSEDSPNLSYQLLVYDDDGSNGIPGSLLESKNVSISNVNLSGRYASHDCTDLDIEIDSGGLYVGARWDTFAINPSADFYICTDTSLSTPVSKAYSSSSVLGDIWNPLHQNSGGVARAIGVRAEFDGDDGDGGGGDGGEVDTSPCIPTDTTLCLLNGRFEVEIVWENFVGSTGSGHRQLLTDQSGLFWFFDAQNIEFLVKVINGCSLNNRYWVFAAATTNVEYTMTVRDTTSGLSKPYHNVLGVSSPAVTDSEAFATCP